MLSVQENYIIEQNEIIELLEEECRRLGEELILSSSQRQEIESKLEDFEALSTLRGPRVRNSNTQTDTQGNDADREEGQEGPSQDTHDEEPKTQYAIGRNLSVSRGQHDVFTLTIIAVRAAGIHMSLRHDSRRSHAANAFQNFIDELDHAYEDDNAGIFQVVNGMVLIAAEAPSKKPSSIASIIKKTYHHIQKYENAMKKENISAHMAIHRGITTVSRPKNIPMPYVSGDTLTITGEILRIAESLNKAIVASAEALGSKTQNAEALCQIQTKPTGKTIRLYNVELNDDF